MADAVNVQLEVLTRAGDPAQHGIAVDDSELFSLTSDSDSYTSDTGAFATTVYNFYAAQVAGDNVSTVEIIWKVWIGGTAVSGGKTTNEGVIATIASDNDLEAEVNKHIAHALSGDQAQPGL